MTGIVSSSALPEHRQKLKLGDVEYDIFVGNAFAPTETTRLLVECALREIEAQQRVLDLGCGTGIVGLAIAEAKNLPTIYLSDIHDESRKAVEANFKSTGRAFEFRSGSLFEPWAGERFDVIVDDVSGVSSPVAALSSWFQHAPCESGLDGTALVTRVITEAQNYLAPGGKLVFPAISLSRTDQILECAKQHFKRVERIGTRDWPMPPELAKHHQTLEECARKGAFQLIRKFGMLVGRTDIYLAE
jgi:methylase of polypeptide subunit release factors